MAYTDQILWCRRMKTFFSTVDLDKDGFLTEEDLKKRLEMRLAEDSSLNQAEEEEKLKKVWIFFYNAGEEVGPGYKLGREKFLENMWKVTNKPEFETMLKTMTKGLMGKKTHITKEDHMKGVTKILPAEHASAAFDAMDEDKSGCLTEEKLFKALLFFYTNKDDAGSPLNVLMGPLVD